MEGGKPENPEKNPQSTGEINNSTHITSKFDNQQATIYPGGHPSSYIPVRLGLTLELSGERQRANHRRSFLIVFTSPWSVDIFVIHSKLNLSILSVAFVNI